MEYKFNEDESHSFVFEAFPVYCRDDGPAYVCGYSLESAHVVLYPQELWISIDDSWVRDHRDLSKRLLEALIADHASGKFDE